jgi:4'-phosphopantetheinyl transferase
LAQWQSSEIDFKLNIGELHVWRALLPLVITIEEDLLSVEELSRLQRFHFERERMIYVFAHSMLRRLLGRYLDVDPTQVKLDYTHYGKPYLAGGQRTPPLEFNLSHSGDLVLIAVGVGNPVGVDVEVVRPLPDLDQVAERFFSYAEYQELQSLTGEEKAAAFYRCWTRKEAVIKACGEGLSIPLDRFQVSLLPGKPARMLQSPDSRPWLLVDLAPASGYTAAAAVPTAELRVSCFSYGRASG